MVTGERAERSHPGLFGKSSQKDLLCIGNMRTEGAEDGYTVLSLSSRVDKCTI